MNTINNKYVKITFKRRNEALSGWWEGLQGSCATWPPVSAHNSLSHQNQFPVTRLNLTLSSAPSCHPSQSNLSLSTFLSLVSSSHPFFVTFLSPCLCGLNLIFYLTVYQLLYESVILWSLWLVRLGSHIHDFEQRRTATLEFSKSWSISYGNWSMAQDMFVIVEHL